MFGKIIFKLILLPRITILWFLVLLPKFYTLIVLVLKVAITIFMILVPKIFLVAGGCVVWHTDCVLVPCPWHLFRYRFGANLLFWSALGRDAGRWPGTSTWKRPCPRTRQVYAAPENV